MTEPKIRYRVETIDQDTGQVRTEIITNRPDAIRWSVEMDIDGLGLIQEENDYGEGWYDKGEKVWGLDVYDELNEEDKV